MKVRSFLAIELPESARNALEGFRSQIALPQFDVRWVLPKNIHLTFRFFGEVPMETIPGLSEAARIAAYTTRPFMIMLRGVGAFPNARNPRVVWTGVEDPTPLYQLERCLSTELDGIGWPPPDKPFQPHLTMGRVRSNRGRRELEECLERNRDQAVGGFLAEHMSLVKSDLHPTGPVYTTLERFVFPVSPKTQSQNGVTDGKG